MLTIKTSKRDVIAFPEDLLEELGLKDGEKVVIKIKKDTISINRDLKDFFSLEGALKDIDIESPVKELDKAWKKWKPRKSL
jgi:antitoxin component of MazEF toxin-antitoxin module